MKILLLLSNITSSSFLGLLVRPLHPGTNRRSPRSRFFGKNPQARAAGGTDVTPLEGYPV